MLNGLVTIVDPTAAYCCLLLPSAAYCCAYEMLCTSRTVHNPYVACTSSRSAAGLPRKIQKMKLRARYVWSVRYPIQHLYVNGYYSVAALPPTAVVLTMTYEVIREFIHWNTRGYVGIYMLQERRGSKGFKQRIMEIFSYLLWRRERISGCVSYIHTFSTGTSPTLDYLHA